MERQLKSIHQRVCKASAVVNKQIVDRRFRPWESRLAVEDLESACEELKALIAKTDGGR